MTIYVGFTTGGGPPTWNLMFGALGLYVPGGWKFLRGDPGPTDWARNDLVYQFLDNDDGEWLLQVDRDATLHPRTIERLMSWGKPAVGALAFMRGVPPLPTVWTEFRENERTNQYGLDVEGTLEWLTKHNITSNGAFMLKDAPPDSLIEVKVTGMHCFLAHRSVFEAIEPPWYEYPADRTKGNRGEDTNFCIKARKAGVKLYVDRSIIAGHSAGERSIGATDFVAYTSIMQKIGGE